MDSRFGRIRELFNGTSRRRRHPYSEIAVIYDHIMKHVDYAVWTDYIISVFDRFQPDAHNILELACGTGTLTVELSRRGYSMTCSDRSPAMLKAAEEKFRSSGLSPGCFVADMTALPLSAHYDATLCLYDSLNYLVTSDEFIQALRETAAVISVGGLLIFDVCTVRNSEMFFTDNTMIETYDNVTCERTCRYDSVKRIQENHFRIERPGKKDVFESHAQRIYLLDEITHMLDGLPFRELGRFNDMSFARGTEDSDRVHFVLQKV